LPLFFVVGRPSSSPSWLPHDCKLIAEEGGAGGAAVGGVPGLDVCGAEVAKLTEETVHFYDFTHPRRSVVLRSSHRECVHGS